MSTSIVETGWVCRVAVRYLGSVPPVTRPVLPPLVSRMGTNRTGSGGTACTATARVPERGQLLSVEEASASCPFGLMVARIRSPGCTRVPGKTNWCSGLAGLTWGLAPPVIERSSERTMVVPEKISSRTRGAGLPAGKGCDSVPNTFTRTGLPFATRGTPPSYRWTAWVRYTLSSVRFGAEPVTSSRADPETAPAAAMISVLPADKAVTSPLELTVAMPGTAALQVMATPVMT